MASKNKKTGTDKSETYSIHIMITVFTCTIISTGSLSILQNHSWVEGQKLWLISRAAALTAFIVLTLLMSIGIILSHPLNKKKWRLTPKLLSWHQALNITFFALICVHLIFSAADHKSGISWLDLLFPIHSKYHAWAMISGSLGLYLFIFTSLTATFRKRFIRFWLPLHRFSILIWILVFLHGIFGGTDTREYILLYYGAGLFLLILFLWGQVSGQTSWSSWKLKFLNRDSAKE